MEPISRLTALYEILRRRTGTQAESTGRSREKSGGESSSESNELARTPRERIELIELERQIRARLQEQPHAARLSSASKRWVIASLLGWELDARLQNEAKFNALVRSVQQSIDGDAGLKAKFERVMEQLSK